MRPGKRRRRLAAHFLAAALVAACVVAMPAAAMSNRTGDETLSPRLAELAKPSVRSASPARQAAILDVVPEGPGSLLRQGGRVLVDVRFEGGAGTSLNDLRATGARIVHFSRPYQTVTVAATPASLHKLAGVRGVQSVIEDLAPIVSATGGPPVTSDVNLCFGAATSEGDIQLRAMEARDAFSVDGLGATVGILSDSFDTDGFAPTHAGQDVTSGDLPGSENLCGNTSPVNVLEDYIASQPFDPPPTDEGRAMAQIVHDIAPGASLAFATAFNGELDFADNIRALARAGAKVIVDDVLYLDEPFFQDGPVAVAVNDVTTDDEVTYFSAAGNNNLIDRSGNNIASWEAPSFRDADSCPTGAPDYADNCMDFDPDGGVDATFGITVEANKALTVDLQWAQPWHGVTTDLDAYLLDSDDSLVASSESFNTTLSEEPVEILSWTNGSATSQTVKLVINRCDVNCGGANGGDRDTPLLKFALLQNGGGVTSVEYPTSSGGDTVGPTIFGHNGAANTMSVGAIRFNTTLAPESFSSRGPVVHYFEPVTGTIPAARLVSPQTIDKPDVVATNGGASTFFGSCVSNVWRFFGTSASAPHAAAVAALELNARPSATVSQVKQAQTLTADAVGSFGTEAVGAGLVNANNAVGNILGVGPGSGSNVSPGFAPPPCLQSPPTPPPTPTPTPTPTPSPVPIVESDRNPPATFLGKRPRKVVLTRRNSVLLAFGFLATEDDSTFVCRIDRGQLRQCAKNLIRWFPVGRHAVRVKARDAAGNVDPTPAVYRFRVKRIA